MATRDYVPVAADDWYQRRRDDPEGEFFRHVADQGPRKGEGGATRQGIYCLSAGGKLLYWKNAGQLPDEMRKALRWGLDAWKRLPAEERRPGAVHVADLGSVDPRYARKAPPGALVQSVYTRILDHDADGGLCRGSPTAKWGEAAARDHLWVTEGEWKSLVRPDVRKGDRFPLPARLATRILRFHLIDNTRGEPPMWRREDVRASRLDAEVEEATPARLRLRLEGTALLASAADAGKADRGYDARLLGYVGYDARRGVIDRFDLVAVGDHWGEGTYTRNARPGRKPLGVAFELARGDAADQVPPQAAREIDTYLGKGE